MTLAAVVWRAGQVIGAVWLTVLALGVLAIVTGGVLEHVKLRIQRRRRERSAATDRGRVLLHTPAPRLRPYAARPRDLYARRN